MAVQVSTTAPRILVVDDEKYIRDILLRALAGAGYQLHAAATAQDALEHFGQHGADVVLSDLQMPGMSGIGLLQAIKALDDSVGFLLLTGAGTLHDTIQALRLQADDYLLKPPNLEEVAIAVERSLRHRRLLLENRYYQQHLEERVAEQAEQLETLFVEALLTLANAIEARDGYTGGHVERVTHYAVAIGTELGLPPEELRSLWVGALLHDVGKIGVPDTILRKPGKLTEEEYELMKGHPVVGAAIMERSSFLRPALRAVRDHHERWDGGGYPEGASGEAISLAGRILAVADAFDAIITTRPYRSPRTPEEAVAELQRSAGTYFDPAVVQAFIRARTRGFPVDPSVPKLPGREVPRLDTRDPGS